MNLQRLACLLLSACFALPSIGQTAHPADTVYLVKNDPADAAHTVYIDPGNNDSLYRQLTGFTFDREQQKTYRSQVAALKKKWGRLNKPATGQLPRLWIPAFEYKQQYYLYRPCDLYSHWGIGITDSTYIGYSTDGPAVSRISRFAVPESGRYALQLQSATSSKSINIYLVDAARGLAVFEERLPGQAGRYYLMVAADKARQLPVIVNHCPEDKTDEFVFDHTDFEKLLSPLRKK